jgi:DNA-binding winged helix-turn-helix (wHTH) protein
MKNRAERARLGEFEVNFRTGEVFAVGGAEQPRRIPLRQQPFEVLRMLMEAGGEMVSRREIKKVLWSKDTVVDFDHSINVAIGILRRVMADSAESPQYIETLARRGYRLRVPVEWVETESTMAKPASPPRPAHPDGLIGMKVADYRVLEFIGAGGTGLVYKAEDKQARHVALKFLPEDLANDPRA